MFLGLTCPVFFSWAADTTKGLGCWYYQVIVPALLDNFYIEWRQTYIFHLSGLCTAALFPQKEQKNREGAPFAPPRGGRRVQQKYQWEFRIEKKKVDSALFWILIDVFFCARRRHWRSRSVAK